ncbi:MAG: cytochrome c oxidase, cbb3-type, CcoQ subunit [Campylobacter sp.]|nr:cytochrome c oxidase, cbb3-type, CcoQ subunit [Campylobacter sp.]
MDMEQVRFIQGVAFFIFVVVLCLVLYGYLFHLRRSEKTGERNYEKYANLALDDDISDKVLEPKVPYSSQDLNDKKEFKK